MSCSNASTKENSENPDPERREVINMRPNQEKTKYEIINVKSAIPKYRQELLKWNGWGYKDSKFVITNNKNIEVKFSGDRYPIGGCKLPLVETWVKDTFNVKLENPVLPQEMPSDDQYPKSLIPQEIVLKMVDNDISYSVKGIDRLVRAHGHTLNDIYVLRNGMFKRIPDIVAWPKSHNDVVYLVNLANEHNLVIIPFGGGTAVSGAVECPLDEPRAIISLDTSQMNRILRVDTGNLVACAESGIIGQDLERELSKRGFTMGHEPDSYEFSSLGGWVATRASGMKKNVYGNIEDLLVHVKMVTPKGVLEKNCQVPRLSCGPDFNHIIMGSEGSLGVITEVTFKIRPLPKCKKYGSVVFPDFESGVKCMREVALKRCQPASIRLMDNEQFKFGMILKPEVGKMTAFTDMIKKLYLTKWKRFSIDEMCVLTLLFEGNNNEVKNQEKNVYDIAQSFGGIPAGEANGERGYTLTFVIAYIRDLAMQYRIVAESFETSVPWDRALSLCKNTKNRVATECQKLKIDKYYISCRVTQVYDAGCVIYFYLAFCHAGHSDPVSVHHSVESAARDEIIANGGSVSHHHGVGKIRAPWYKSTVSHLGEALFTSAKHTLDPNNVFATNNLVHKSKL